MLIYRYNVDIFLPIYRYHRYAKLRINDSTTNIAFSNHICWNIQPKQWIVAHAETSTISIPVYSDMRFRFKLCSHCQSDQLDQARSSKLVWSSRYKWSGVVGEVYLCRPSLGLPPRIFLTCQKFKWRSSSQAVEKRSCIGPIGRVEDRVDRKAIV